MKTKELIKLNKRHSIVEATYEKKDTEYVVCSNYNPNGEEYRQWENGTYCTSLEDAIQFAATHCFGFMYMYVYVEFDGADFTRKIFNNYKDAYKYFEEKYKEYSSYEDCLYASGISKDLDGNLIASISYDEDENVDFTNMDLILIEVRVK